jgi:hypothetical protein
MKVIVSEDAVRSLIGSPDSYKVHLLLSFAIEGRHVILFEDQSALQDWIARQDPALRASYSRTAEFSARTASLMASNASTIYIAGDGAAEWRDPISRVSIDEALDVLREPLGVFVENADNDWQFVVGLMRPAEREQVKKHLSKGWLVALHGGGATLPERIRDRASSPYRALRTFAVFDSDRRHPVELEDDWSPTGQEACQGFVVEQVANQCLSSRYWRLERRFIESYMPIEEISATISGNIPREAPIAFSRMSKDEQWYFNMKKGFSGDSPIENAHRNRGMYADVSEGDRIILHHGFGRKLADRYSELANREFNWDSAALREASVAISNLMRLI